MVTNNIHSEHIVLELLGIDKKWIRNSKGKWIDEKTTENARKSAKERFEEVSALKKKGWFF